MQMASRRGKKRQTGRIFRLQPRTPLLHFYFYLWRFLIIYFQIFHKKKCWSTCHPVHRGLRGFSTLTSSDKIPSVHHFAVHRVRCEVTRYQHNKVKGKVSEEALDHLYQKAKKFSSTSSVVNTVLHYWSRCQVTNTDLHFSTWFGFCSRILDMAKTRNVIWIWHNAKQATSIWIEFIHELMLRDLDLGWTEKHKSKDNGRNNDLPIVHVNKETFFNHGLKRL